MRLLASCCLLVVACGRIDFGESGTSTPVAAAAGTIAAGGGFSCAIRDGAVWCWGRSDARQLGVDTYMPQPLPVQAQLPGRMVKIAANDVGACALDEDGAVWCWGNDVMPAQESELLRPARAIAAGGTHVCAILDDSSLWCWGGNHSGEVGVDPLVQLQVDTPVMVLASVTQVAAGGEFTCAVRGDASVWCWGANYSGQLGDGTGVGRFTPARIPGVSAIAIAAGFLHACALDVNGRYRCWGDNGEGQLGDGSQEEIALSPTAASAPADFVTLIAGGYATCSIDADGHPWCWGNGNNGEQGDGNRFDYGSPVEHAESDIIAIVQGDAHGCLEHEDGTIQCWGYGSHGELGDGRIAALTPRKVPLPAPATFIAAGKTHACAILTNGNQLWCWGSDDAGELGTGADQSPQGSSMTPIQVPIGTVNWVGAGYEHTCALVNGDYYCWGLNDAGQVGSAPVQYSHDLAIVPGLPNPNGAGCAGPQYTCTANASGLECWGVDDYGQLGDGGGATSLTPRVVGTGMQPACGDLFACAKIAGGSIGCWGYNGAGQIGIGGPDANKHPLTPISSAATYMGVSAGDTHACAVHADATAVDCWGANNAGQIGNGTTDPQPLPVTVPGIVSGVAEVAAGGDTTCARGNATQCWGLNDVGQAGDGTAVTHTSPVTLPMDVFSIAVGERFACAALFTPGGDVVCWGDNDSGQIGSGPQTRALVPVNVMFP